MKKSISIAVLLLACCLLLTACGGYRSSFKATSMVENCNSTAASMRFSTLEGTKVYTLKTAKDAETRLHYSGTLETGKATVYYDDDGEKKTLFEIGAGEEASGAVDVAAGAKVYVIFETNEACTGGDFSFELKKTT